MQLNEILYGGDYNPEQWLDSPEILKKDIEMLQEAKINTVSMGMFSWSTLEPEEGVYNLDYMEELINRLYANGISTILSTPTGARPKWMTDKYPEILRVNKDGVRYLFGGRHNHCYTSPVYREKTRLINTLLGERFGKHPAVRMWHLSNEYGGECYCPLCQEAFRTWLKNRYQTIDKVNKVWWTTFWSHTYHSFDQIEAPSPLGETMVHGLNLDWRRFVSDQTIDFMKWEIACIKATGSTLPTTTNYMYHFPGIDYYHMSQFIDVVSWDTYPVWHKQDDIIPALDCGMQHDFMRSLKQKPFLLMESCPSSPNWHGISKLKRPGLLTTAGLHAIAHGSDSVLYFQIRQSRGSSEKFHGAVIDHYGETDSRVFRECASLGDDLSKLSEIIDSDIEAKVAIINDLNNIWAMDDAQGPRNDGLNYHEVMMNSYRALRNHGVNVDIITQEQDLAPYTLVIAPMLYLFRANIEDRIRTFVEQGGHFVMTHWSGIVDENDLTFLGGNPHKLMDVFGLRNTETDALFAGHTNRFVAEEGAMEGALTGEYEVKHLCALLEVQAAEVLCIYGEEFYAGAPAVTKNHFGLGVAYYVGADVEEGFYADLYRQVISNAKVPRIVRGIVPAGVEVSSRNNDKFIYVFVQSFKTGIVDLKEMELEGELIYGGSDHLLDAYETNIYRIEK